MQTRKFLAVALVASLSTAPAFAARADQPSLTPSEASLVAGSFIVALPFSLAYIGGAKISETVSEELSARKRWNVTGVREQGETTAVELRSDDGKIQMDMTVVTRTVRAQRLQVRDQLDIDRIGKSGFVVKKGAATIGVLTQPDSGLVHSKARG